MGLAKGKKKKTNKKNTLTRWEEYLCLFASCCENRLRERKSSQALSQQLRFCAGDQNASPSYGQLATPVTLSCSL